MKYLFLFILYWSVKSNTYGQEETALMQMVNAEKSFAGYARSTGITAAFMKYLDDSAKVFEGGKILNGIDPKTELLRSKLSEIGEKHNANVEQTAVAWLMQLGTLPIIGSLNEDRIKNAATAAEIKLSQEDWYELLHIAQLK